MTPQRDAPRPQAIRGARTMALASLLSCAPGPELHRLTPVRVDMVLPHADYVRQIAVGPGGDLLATWGRDGLRLWDVTRPTVRCMPALAGDVDPGHGRLAGNEVRAGLRPSDLVGLGFAGTPPVLVAASSSGVILGFDTDTCAEIARTELGSPAKAMSTSADLFAVSTDRAATVWRVPQWSTPISRLTLDVTSVDVVALDAGSGWLAVGHGEEFGYVDAGPIGGPLARLADPGGTEVSFTQFGALAIDGDRAVWALETGIEDERLTRIPTSLAVRSSVASVFAPTRGLSGYQQMGFRDDEVLLVATWLDLGDGAGRDQLAVVPVSTRLEPRAPRELSDDRWESNTAEAERVAFDRTIDPTHLGLGDQDGNVIVVRLSDGEVRMRVDKRAYPRATEAACQRALARLVDLARGSAGDSWFGPMAQEALAVLEAPARRGKLLEACERDALTFDVSCMRHAPDFQAAYQCYFGKRMVASLVEAL